MTGLARIHVILCGICVEYMLPAVMAFEIHHLSMGTLKPCFPTEQAEAVCCMDNICPAHDLSMNGNRLLPHHSFRIGMDQDNPRTEAPSLKQQFAACDCNARDIEMGSIAPEELLRAMMSLPSMGPHLLHGFWCRFWS